MVGFLDKTRKAKFCGGATLCLELTFPNKQKNFQKQTKIANFIV
jgi:hypothetical protein